MAAGVCVGLAPATLWLVGFHRRRVTLAAPVMLSPFAGWSPPSRHQHNCRRRDQLRIFVWVCRCAFCIVILSTAGRRCVCGRAYRRNRGVHPQGRGAFVFLCEPPQFTSRATHVPAAVGSRSITLFARAFDCSAPSCPTYRARHCTHAPAPTHTHTHTHRERESE